MEFKTHINIQKKQILSYNDSIMLIGSCFTENIGKQFTNLGFNVLVNPFGIVYNPLSIATSLERLINSNTIQEKELFNHQGMWHHWLYHGNFSSPNKNHAFEKMNAAFYDASKRLSTCSKLIITFGSSWIYEHENKVVSNCHKVSQKMFKQRRLEINEITEHLIPILEQLQKNNPELQILLTVSPVRYFGQGALASQTNKATLLLACEKLTNKFDWISYFPSYEIMMDELRDYRFYQDDMIHPSPLAVNYIWERFCETYFTKETNKIIPQVIKLRKALEHKPLHADSKSYNDFIMHREETIKKLKAKYPYINI